MKTTLHNEQTPSPSKMPSQVILQRPKPNIPQKKARVDEVFRLKKEIEEMRTARDEAVDTRDMMAEDLLTAHEKVQEIEDKLGEKSREVRTWREKAEKLSNEIMEEKRLAAETKQSLKRMEKMSTSTRGVEVRREEEQMQLRQQIEQLTAALAEKDSQLIEKASVATGSEDQLQSSLQEAQLRFESGLREAEDRWRSLLAEEEKLRRAAEGDLRSMKDYYESRLKETEQRANSQIEEQQKRVHASETALQEQMNRMEVDSTSQQQLQRLIATHEAEMNEQRQRCNQFKRMSERLTAQIKQAAASKTNLEQTGHVMRHRIEDMKSEIAALQLQLRDYHTPGSFSGASSEAPQSSQNGWQAGGRWK
jgi:YD repeat-containing protein